MKYTSFLAALLLALQCHGQSSVSLRNNTWLDFEVRLSQAGSHTLDPSEWSLASNRVIPWATDQVLFTTDRDSSAVPMGDSIFLAVELVANGDTAELMFRLDGVNGGSEMQYSGALPGQGDAWYDDGAFHEISGSFGGKDVTMKYRPENGDGDMDRNVLFVIHQDPIYEMDPADFNDPNVINVVNYNVQFLPFFIGGFDNGVRAPLIPPVLDPGLDMVVIEEAFDPLPRDLTLKPAMQAQGFNYDTGILNDYLPFNGGVIIFSRWPIEASAEIDFALCGPNSGDCFANKGVMYAKVNKLGKSYHVFGTHMDAGSDPDDVEAKTLQYAEMRDFIAAQNIPPNESAIYAGDFNTRPGSSANLWQSMMDSLDPLLPEYQGYWSSTMSVDTGDIIDHAWVDRRYLIPTLATNEILTLRSIDDDMWDISDLSDHRTSWGRFIFPDISYSPFDSSLCPNDDVTLSVSGSGAALSYQWFFNGGPINGATGPDLVLTGLQAADAGDYSCQVSYSAIHGTKNDPVNILFYPNGPDTVRAELMLETWTLDLSCGVGTAEEAKAWVRVYPNPVEDFLRVELIDLPPGADLLLRDARGRVVMRREMKGVQAEMELGGLSKGLYLLEIRAGKRRLLEKLVLD